MKNDREAIEKNYRAQLEALVDKDFTTLSSLLTKGFTRTHINGNTQTQQEWIGQLKQGQMIYHSFDFLDTKITVDGTTATLVGRVNSDATLYSEHRIWPLQIRQTFLRSGGQWLASRSIITLW
ncbi:nuclear transport factor 2 family protein [Brooklawnia sp.]|uniref:nuclear transport factor 2 family protein n=1 Tax=Brooklawnia sp. TaxID=2699740 RepID=UPI00312045BE